MTMPPVVSILRSVLTVALLFAAAGSTSLAPAAEPLLEEQMLFTADPFHLLQHSTTTII